MIMFLHLLFFFITSNTVSDGRIVRALLGRNVSFSFMLKTRDITKFDHGTSRFLTVWPNANYQLVPDKLNKIHVSVNVSAAETIIVTINVLNISTNDGGIYTAKKQFNWKEFNDSVDLRIFDESMLPRIDVVRQITLNSSLLLQCKLCNTSGMLTKNILWKLNASLIETEDRFSVSNDFLSISNLTAGDQHNVYTCMEQGSEIESDPYKIQSSDPTVIKFTPNITAVFEHESMNVSCNSKCSPLCTWQWTKIDPTSGQERVVSGENILKIQNFTKQDAGKYSCKVQNILRGTTVVSHISLDVIYTTSDMTTTPTRKDGTEATVLGKDIPTANSKEDDIEDNASPSKHLLMYMFIGFGIGILLAFVVFSCLRQKCQKREVNNVTFQVRGEEIPPVENPAESYWTIISNAGGELSTALESNANQIAQPTLSYNKDTSAVNQLETSEFIIKEDEMELDGYIHPIHTSPLNTGVSSRRHTTVV